MILRDLTDILCVILQLTSYYPQLPLTLPSPPTSAKDYHCYSRGNRRWCPVVPSSVKEQGGQGSVIYCRCSSCQPGILAKCRGLWTGVSEAQAPALSCYLLSKQSSLWLEQTKTKPIPYTTKNIEKKPNQNQRTELRYSLQGSYS